MPLDNSLEIKKPTFKQNSKPGRKKRNGWEALHKHFDKQTEIESERHV